MVQKEKYFDKLVINGNNDVYVFENYSNYIDFANEMQGKLTGNALARQNQIDAPNYYSSNDGEDWFGAKSGNELKTEINQYLYSSELATNTETLLNNEKINNKFSRLDQTKKMKFTEQEIGVFSFDLASLGLLPIVEYYSPLLKRIVSGNNVKSFTNEQGKRIFFHVEKPFIPKHLCNYNAKSQGFYSSFFQRNVDKNDLIEEVNLNRNEIDYYYPEQEKIEQHFVEQRQVVNQDGQKKFTTTWKKSFVYFPIQDKPMPRVDVVVISSFSAGVDAIDFQYGATIAVALAKKLTQFNIDFQILIATPKQWDIAPRPKQYTFIKAKAKNDVLDNAKIAILTGDPRQYRYTKFKVDFALAQEAGRSDKVDSGFGIPIRDTNEVKEKYIEYLKNSLDPSDNEVAKKPETILVVGGVNTYDGAENQYQDILRQLQNIQ
jgi:hypothetical protein